MFAVLMKPYTYSYVPAFRELAELLGQVKPQTVSKEEIDNSGLEILQLAALEQYEKDGKIASNCVERVSSSRIISLLS